MKRIVIQFLVSNSLTKILQVIILPHRTRTNRMSLKFLDEGILGSETLTKKRPSGYPDLPKFRTIANSFEEVHTDPGGPKFEGLSSL